MAERRTLRSKDPTLQERFKQEFHRAPVGAVPGEFSFVKHINTETPRMQVFSYNADQCHEYDPPDIQALFAHLEAFPDLIHWVNIEGYGNNTFLQHLQQYFNIHNLAIEDVVSLHQRPKIEHYEGHEFIISRMLYFYQEELVNEQVAFFVFDKVVITIQEELEDCLHSVRERILKAKGSIRKRGAHYLAYALIDAIVDNYFPMLEHISDQLDDIEEHIIHNPQPQSIQELIQIKKQLIQIRKAVLAERDKISELSRNGFGSKEDKMELYLRDAHDHCLQIIEIIETEKEITYSLMELYMSSLSNRTNEVMKFLTILSSIFIPLTFIAGIYGMNFAPQSLNDEALPLNMPELYSPYGYVATWGVMISIVIGLIIYFKRKKWI